MQANTAVQRLSLLRACILSVSEGTKQDRPMKKDYLCVDGIHLNITGTDIEGLHDELYLPTVEWMQITEAAQETVLDFSVFKGLKTLMISSLEAYVFPEEICALPRLNRINCSGRCLLPPEIGEMTGLRELFLNGDCVLNMTENIVRLPNLRLLHVSCYGDSTPCPMPRWISRIPSLEELHLFLCRFSEIDPNINELINLSALCFQGALSAVREFPSLSKLQKLERLEITGNGYPSIPKPSYRLLASVLDGIADLHGLKSLDLSEWRSRKKADYLVLTDQGKSIPDVFDRYPELYSLNLSGMRIDFLPPSVLRRSNLQRLDVSGNQISPKDALRH
jgi:Leucine-rich repeat (LRR) protein